VKCNFRHNYIHFSIKPKITIQQGVFLQTKSYTSFTLHSIFIFFGKPSSFIIRYMQKHFRLKCDLMYVTDEYTDVNMELTWSRDQSLIYIHKQLVDWYTESVGVFLVS